MGLLVQTICRVTSVPHICSAHRKALQMCVINGRLSFHLAENTSTNQPLCRYISVHVPKANKPSITIMQQKRLCAESNYIRHTRLNAGTAGQTDDYSSHTGQSNKWKSNRRHNTALLVKICVPTPFDQCISSPLKSIH